MRKRFGKRFWITMVIVIAVIGSISAVGAIERRTGSEGKKASADVGLSDNGINDRWLNSLLDNSIMNRSRWLYNLMNAAGIGQPSPACDPVKVFEEAQSCGIVSEYSEEDMYKPLTRIFVARTAVKAFGYKYHRIDGLADVSTAQMDMSTMVYYGYFTPDANNMVYPDAQISASEYDRLLGELERCRLLKGKNILSFGDSIMHGSGNSNEGIAEIIAQKYRMNAADYSVPGATIGRRKGRGHIRDQIQLAVADGFKPDIILLNGGTNDMNHLKLGELSTGYDMSKAADSDFTPGLEKTFWSLSQNWYGVPVVYIRVHNMDLGLDANERRFGERGIETSVKWGASTVDLYNNANMNTEISSNRERYTYKAPGEKTCDSIHPNALGYAKFYLPLISEAVVNQF